MSSPSSTAALLAYNPQRFTELYLTGGDYSGNAFHKAQPSSANTYQSSQPQQNAGDNKVSAGDRGEQSENSCNLFCGL